ncbi:hypothetical protein BN1708_018246, partial [Verticillium longisporum]
PLAPRDAPHRRPPSQSPDWPVEPDTLWAARL